MTANDYDYARSFLQFATDRTNHTPRLQVDASCRLIAADGTVREYFMTVSCISETMYAEKDLVQQPASEFILIASSDDEFLMTKSYLCAGRDVREAHRIGEKMSTHDGRGSTMLRIQVEMARFPRMRRLETDLEISEAILSNRILNGRSILQDEDGQDTIIMDYPIKTCNTPFDRRQWQIDTGRILFADTASAGFSGLAIERFYPAYIVANRRHWAEIAVYKPTPVGDSGIFHAHYADIRRLNLQTEIYAAE